jgi:hypothetical protein
MKTEDLIAMLARGADTSDAPEQNDWKKRLALSLGGGLLIATLLVIVFLHMRPDIGVNLDAVLLKAGFSAMISVLALPLALRLMRPGHALGWRIGSAIAFLGIAIVIGLVALAGAAPQQRLTALMGGGFPWCVALVPVLAAPAAALLVWLMRGFAPTNLPLTGAAIGGVAGGIGAMAYAMYCPVDSVAFVAIWYSAAIALCSALGALIASRFLRW